MTDQIVGALLAIGSAPLLVLGIARDAIRNTHR